MRKGTTNRLWPMTGALAMILAGGAGCRTGRPVPGNKGNAPSASTSANAPATSVAPGNKPAASAAEGGGTTNDTSRAWPFPGQPGKPASPQRVVQVKPTSQAGDIPGVPRLRMPSPHRSPFRPEGLAEPAKPPAVKTRQETTRRRPTRLPPSPVPEWTRLQEFPEGTLRPIEVKPLPTPPGPAESAPTPSERATGPETATPSAPSVRLTGIIWGEPRMAILEDEKGHYIVQEGDGVPGGYTVGSISPHKIVLYQREKPPLVLYLEGKKG